MTQIGFDDERTRDAWRQYQAMQAAAHMQRAAERAVAALAALGEAWGNLATQVAQSIEEAFKDVD